MVDTRSSPAKAKTAKPAKKGSGRPPLPTNKATKGRAKSSAAKSKPSISKAVSVANKTVTARAAGEAYVKVEADTSKANRFTDEEDVYICKAFMSCTTNSIRGADQKGDEFWQQVHTKFYLLYNEEVEVAIGKKWTWKSVRNRFQKTLAKSVQRFNGY